MYWKSKTHKMIAQSADYITTLFGIIVSYLLLYYLNNYFPSVIPEPFIIQNIHIYQAVLLSIFYVYIYEKYGAYCYLRFTSLTKEYIIVLKTNTIGIIAAIILSFITKENTIPQAFFLLLYLVFLILFNLEKTLLFYAAKIIRRDQNKRHSVIIVGTGARAKKLIKTIKLNYCWGLDIKGILTCDSKNIGNEYYGIKVIDSYKNLSNVLKNNNPSELIITISSSKYDDIKNILEVCEREGVHVKLNSDIFGNITKRVIVEKILGINFLSYYMTQNNEFALSIKRLIDVIISSISLIIFLPIMIIASICILISDGLPIFYKWKVIGYNKKPITSWKFRTMVKNADFLKQELLNANEMSGPVFKLTNDPRILYVGKFLRKYSLDELPQLWSVFIGDLSIVGPRPPLVYEFKEFSDWHRRKLSVKPGLTCLWQINGRNNIKSFDDWVKLDLEYIDNWSLSLDFKILLKTIPAVIFAKGAK